MEAAEGNGDGPPVAVLTKKFESGVASIREYFKKGILKGFL